MNEERVLAWHFLPEDGRLRYGPRTKVAIGETLSADGPIMICNNGMHASVRAIDALTYAPGPVICRVEVWGELASQEYKIAGRHRLCLAKADATNVLHEFACLCAERALRTAKVEDRIYWETIETKRKWLRGEATDDQLSAARSAARSAAWSAAESAAESAAWSAAWLAAESAQNEDLERLLLELLATTSHGA